MADYGYLSDTDESAVEELISQAQELSVLEQVSKINCSGFTDAVLPSDLETRFRKLKSFPLSKPKTTTTTTANDFYHKFLSSSKSELNVGSVSDEESKKKLSANKQNLGGEMGSVKDGKEISLDVKQNPEGKSVLDRESRSGYASSTWNSSNWEEIFMPNEENPDGKIGIHQKSKHGSVSSSSDSSVRWRENVISSPQSKRKRSLNPNPVVSPLGSSNSFVESPSPPRKPGCFWCSPKRVSKKKNKENWSLDWENKNDRCLSDLSTFSVKKQQKLLRKAVKEEEKISREAEKIVNWAKQASARMSFDGIDDELSEDDSAK